jgi:hypothetical protein
VRLRVDERTRRYAARRASEGKSKREIIIPIRAIDVTTH